MKYKIKRKCRKVMKNPAAKRIQIFQWSRVASNFEYSIKLPKHYVNTSPFYSKGDIFCNGTYINYVHAKRKYNNYKLVETFDINTDSLVNLILKFFQFYIWDMKLYIDYSKNWLGDWCLITQSLMKNENRKAEVSLEYWYMI